MDKLRKFLNGSDDSQSNEESQGITAQVLDASSLSYSTRIKGFIILFVLSFVLSILATALIALPRGLILFAIFYTVGNVLGMGSTMFLMGPWRQLKSMFNEKRILSTLLVLCFMILTLLAALKWKKTVLAIMFCFFQFLAYLWYSISYIPYAQDSVKKTVMSCL